MSIYANLRHRVQMFSQISLIPDLIRKFWAKRCGLYAGVYGNHPISNCSKTKTRTKLLIGCLIIFNIHLKKSCLYVQGYFDKLLRSTKWNASLILLHDYAELVPLCKVMLWKTHIPVRTQKWPPYLIFAGACHGTALLLTTVMASKLVR